MNGNRIQLTLRLNVQYKHYKFIVLAIHSEETETRIQIAHHQVVLSRIAIFLNH